tara:strand:- start:725 stop:967 length:243 start_codon:yes stop_codon:yes gene_type:complete
MSKDSNVIEFPQKKSPYIEMFEAADQQYQEIEAQADIIEQQRKQIEQMQQALDFKAKQQDLTELNGDGNRDRGRYGEDER